MTATAAAPPTERPFAQRAATWVVHAVQASRVNTLPSCRYLPTCSVYALEALEVHGARKGSWLAVKRLCRCRPFGAHGHDPVPQPTTPRNLPRNVDV